MAGRRGPRGQLAEAEQSLGHSSLEARSVAALEKPPWGSLHAGRSPSHILPSNYIGAAALAATRGSFIQLWLRNLRAHVLPKTLTLALTP